MTLKQESFSSWVVKGTFFKDERTAAIEGEFGPLATLLLMRVWNELYLRKSHRIGKTIFNGIAKTLGFDGLQCDRLLAMLCHADVGYLLIDEAGEIGSESVDEKCVTRVKERETWRNNKREGKKKDISKRVPSGFQESSTMERPTPTLTPTVLNINNNSHPPDYSHLAPGDREKHEKADAMLAPVDDPQIQHSSQFINAGRRPMREYREIWLTPQELVCVLDEFFELNLEPKYRKKVFRKVASGISTKCAASGMSPDRISAFNWLTGFELTNALGAVKAEKDLQRSETYLTNARGQ